MRIKEFFTVPAGEKVTEKMFGRVLISSVCGILLCMACLAGTTWAWFTVSIENQGNEIQIASVKPITAIVDGQGAPVKAEEGEYILENREYSLTVGLENTATGPDSLNREQSPVYVVMTAVRDGKSISYCFTFAGGPEGSGQAEVTLVGSEKTAVSFAVSWVRPTAAVAVSSGERIVIGTAETVLPAPAA